VKWNFRSDTAQSLTDDFASFTRSAWPVLHPGTKLHWCWFYDLLCEHLTQLKRKKNLRLLVNCPPRFGENSICSVIFPVLCWLNDPTASFMCASHELDLATAFNLSRRRLIQSAWFQSLFSNRFQLSGDRNQADSFENDRGGASIAASTSAKAMGRGADTIILDDIISANDVLSDATRLATNDWLQFMLPQRLNSPSTSAILLVMQRLHESDPAGFLLEHEPGEWLHLRLPLLAEENERWVFPISKRVVARRVGECLDPKRFPPKVVQQRQRNRLVWASQFQQRPSPIEGNFCLNRKNLCPSLC
jgi:hypothetical protein